MSFSEISSLAQQSVLWAPVPRVDFGWECIESGTPQQNNMKCLGNQLVDAQVRHSGWIDPSFFLMPLCTLQSFLPLEITTLRGCTAWRYEVNSRPPNETRQMDRSRRFRTLDSLMFRHVLSSEIVGRCFNTRNNLWSLKFKVDTWLTISIACIAAQWHDGEIWVLATRHRCRHGAMDRWIQMCSDSVQIGSSVRYPLDSDVFFRYATKTAQRLEMIRFLFPTFLRFLRLCLFWMFWVTAISNSACMTWLTCCNRKSCLCQVLAGEANREATTSMYITSNTCETLKPFKKVSKYQESWITKIHIQKGKHFVLKAQSDNVSFKFRVFPVSC